MPLPNGKCGKTIISYALSTPGMPNLDLNTGTINLDYFVAAPMQTGDITHFVIGLYYSKPQLANYPFPVFWEENNNPPTLTESKYFTNINWKAVKGFGFRATINDNLKVITTNSVDSIIVQVIKKYYKFFCNKLGKLGKIEDNKEKF